MFVGHVFFGLNERYELWREFHLGISFSEGVHERKETEKIHPRKSTAGSPENHLFEQKNQ